MQSNLPSWDFVVVGKRDAVSAAKAVLRESLDGHFDRLRRRAGSENDG